MACVGLDLRMDTDGGSTENQHGPWPPGGAVSGLLPLPCPLEVCSCQAADLAERDTLHPVTHSFLGPLSGYAVD